MKKTLLLLVTLCGIFSAQAQTGLVAHWDMDDSVNDISGNGHHGEAHNIVPAIGKDGVMGHAYYFNGVNSYIYVPYSAGMNMSTGFSICARIKIAGFNSGTCHGNTILDRGQLSPVGTGTYALYFNDLPSGVACGDAVDTTQECFLTGATATSAPLGPSSITDFNYTPHIVTNHWYSVVGTFNDTVYKLYVNDTLVNTTTITTPGLMIGTTTEGLSIGYDTYDSIGGYPYQFKGIIDDIKLFNRPLSGGEVHGYTTGIQSVGLQAEIAIYPNPAHNSLTIHNAENTIMNIYNVVGAKVYEDKITDRSEQINIESLIPGTYITQFIATDGSRICERFIKD